MCVEKKIQISRGSKKKTAQFFFLRQDVQHIFWGGREEKLKKSLLRKIKALENLIIGSRKKVLSVL